MSLSKERLRIAEASHLVGKFSGLDYQQAKVDFNADSAQYIKQQELLHSSRIQLNELMANNNVNQIIVIKDSTIDVHSDLLFDDYGMLPYPPMLLAESRPEHCTGTAGLQKDQLPQLPIPQTEYRLWIYL